MKKRPVGKTMSERLEREKFGASLKKKLRKAAKEMHNLDFTREWTDEDLFERYGITKEEQDFIRASNAPEVQTETFEKTIDGKKKYCVEVQY